MKRLALAVFVVLALSVGVYGYRTDRPWLALCGLAAIPAAMVLLVASFPNYFTRDARRQD